MISSCTDCPCLCVILYRLYIFLSRLVRTVLDCVSAYIDCTRFVVHMVMNCMLVCFALLSAQELSSS